MSINETYLDHKSKKRRPLGAWVLAIYALLYVGVFQLAPTTTLNVLRGYTAMYSKEDIPVFIIYAFLKMSIIIASILTGGGLEIGRKSFLFFVIVYFLGDGIYNFSWGTEIPGLHDFDNWIWYITDFGFPLICTWYFNRPSIKVFFQ
jgi:hypothetical protein